MSKKRTMAEVEAELEALKGVTSAGSGVVSGSAGAGERASQCIVSILRLMASFSGWV